ncbi:MAG: zinc-dependent peptidase [Pseudomonadota bacterium]|nr:MAG: zinc-dependent peptidase [Pseudomonadota bacterium]
MLSRLRRLIGRNPISDRLWRAALTRTPYAKVLPAAKRLQLRALATRFLRSKSFEPAHDFVMPELACVLVALRASLPVLELGLDYYDAWTAIVMYPGDFRVRHNYTDEIGVEHHYVDELCGESLSQGPIVLSWDTVDRQRGTDSSDLVVHECAHKLDILNGDANGFPPLHSSMNRRAWTEAFSRGYEALVDDLDRGEKVSLDPYAATDAAEFFAVASETFFTKPRRLARSYPQVYEQLRLFYRQNPLSLARTKRRSRPSGRRGQN